MTSGTPAPFSFEDDLLGRHLVATGRVSAEQLEACRRAPRAQPGGPDLGSLLVARGLIDGPALYAAMRELVRRAATASAETVVAGRGPPTGHSISPAPVPPGDVGASSGGSGESPFASAGLVPAQLQAALADPARRVGRYVLMDELGRGGMGIVHRAYDPSLRREVAIKMLGQAGAVSPTLVRRFEREALAAARLHHPNIVSVYEAGAHQGRPFLVMDLVAGESLESLLQKEPLPPRRVAEIVRAVAQALEHAHGHGVVHRDVKPENILIDAEGTPRLTDFGLAREAASDDRLTVSGQIVGTPAYMAPEQAGASRGAVGPATDVYGLGGVLYRALAGRPVFVADQMVALIRMVVAEEPEPPRRANPQVHPDLETITLRCLEKEPARRYASAEALAEDLRRFLDGELIHARPVGRVGRARRWARRSPSRLVALVLAGLLAVGVPIGAAATAVRTRAAIGERARDEARAAWAAFERERTEPLDAVGPEARGRMLDERLALGLAAFAAAYRLQTLLPEDAAARAAMFEASVGLGEVALAGEQWSVAASAFERAATLGVDDARGRALLQRVQTERRRVSEEHRAAVEAVLARAREGGLVDRRRYEDALFTLVRYPEAQTVALLGAALDGIAERMREVTRRVYREAAVPTGDEARADAEPIEGIDVALDRWLDAAPGEPIDALARATIDRAARRLQERERRGRSDVMQPGERAADAIVAAEQEREVGEHRGALLAKLCCQALGRIGIREGAVGPLGRYLFADRDELRVVFAGHALAALGGEQAERLLEAAKERFGRSGLFVREVERSQEHLTAGEGLPEQTPEALVERARARLNKRDLDGALADADRAVALAPDDAGAWHVRGLVHVGRGELEAAAADATRAIELDPADARPLSLRGMARRSLGDIPGAMEDLSRAIELDPRAGRVWAARGVARWLQRDLDGAVEDLTRAVELDPGLSVAWAHRGMARRQRGEREGALEDVSRAIEIDPHNAPAWCERAALLRELGDGDGALAACNRAIEIDAGFADAWNHRGVVKRDRSDIEGALADHTRAIELDPKNANAWSNRGMVQCDRGELDAAIADLTHALELAPDLPRGWTNRGIARLAKGDADGAIADHTRAIEIEPALVEAWINRGVARHQKGDLRGAVADLSRAIEVDPTRAFAWANRGNVRTALGEHEAAMADLTRAIELDPDDAVTWLNRGILRYEQKQYPEAVADLTRALEIDPRTPNGWLARGEVKRQMDDLPGALADCTRAIELRPTSFVAFRARAVVRARAGDIEGAIADVERSIELSPDDEHAAKQRAYLADLRKRPK